MTDCYFIYSRAVAVLYLISGHTPQIKLCVNVLDLAADPTCPLCIVEQQTAEHWQQIFPNPVFSFSKPATPLGALTTYPEMVLDCCHSPKHSLRNKNNNSNNNNIHTDPPVLAGRNKLSVDFTQFMFQSNNDQNKWIYWVKFTPWHSPNYDLL